MRRFLVVCISCFIVVGALSSYAVSAIQAPVKKVNLVTNVWPPYVIDEKSEHPGYAYEVVKRAFEAVGYQVSIQVVSWAQARALTIDGKADGLFPDYDSTDNLQYFVYSNAFLTGPLMLYEKITDSSKVIEIPTTNSQVDFFNDLKLYRFGVVDGYTNVPAFDHNAALTKKIVIDDKANLEQLYRGDVDFILIDQLNAQYLLRNEFPEAYSKVLKPVGPILARLPFYVEFSKKAENVEQLRNDFNQGLKIVQNKKIIYQIMREYLYAFIDKDVSVIKK